MILTFNSCGHSRGGDLTIDDGNDSHDNLKPCLPLSAVRNLKDRREVGAPAPESSLTTEWLNSEEAAKFLRLSVKALRNLTSSGQLPFYKLGRRNRYRKYELESILLSQRRGQHYGS